MRFIFPLLLLTSPVFAQAPVQQTVDSMVAGAVATLSQFRGQVLADEAEKAALKQALAAMTKERDDLKAKAEQKPVPKPD